MLGPGRHFIQTVETFKFNPVTDIVDQNDQYIQHNNLYIVRVAPGKVAVIMLDNEYIFLEHRSEPYVFESPQFTLFPADDGQPFWSSTEPKIAAGNFLRLFPAIGDVAVFNVGGNYKTAIKEENQNGAVVYDTSTAQFVDTLSTTRQTLEFPSTMVQRRHIQQGYNAVESEFDYFYTADSIKVGILFSIAYEIKDPELTLTSIPLDQIQHHIETTVTADMGAAIKSTSLQDLLKKPQPALESGEAVDNWQSLAKKELVKHFEKIGISLVQLNIQDHKIENPDLERQITKVGVLSADTHAQLTSIEAKAEIARKEVELKSSIQLEQQEVENKIKLKKAETELQAAEMEVRASTLRSNAEAENQKRIAEVLTSSPQAMLMAYLESFVRALQGGNFSSALPLSDLSNMMSMFMEKITGLVSTKAVLPSPANNGLFANNPIEVSSDSVANPSNNVVSV